MLPTEMHLLAFSCSLWRLGATVQALYMQPLPRRSCSTFTHRAPSKTAQAKTAPPTPSTVSASLASNHRRGPSLGRQQGVWAALHAALPPEPDVGETPAAHAAESRRFSRALAQ